ncbi:MAG: GDSL-type esterase/lipase family protein [Sandaracinaceae bacterium]
MARQRPSGSPRLLLLGALAGLGACSSPVGPWSSPVAPGAKQARPVTVADPMPTQPGTNVPIEHVERLASFHRALRRTRAGGGDAVTRVVHMGDSSIGLDDFPHRLRRRFQERFGDAGPGFVLLQPHNPGYRNRTVRVRASPPWPGLCFIIRRCRRDGFYGLGGATVEAWGGARTRIAPASGRRVSTAELWYAAQPRGGRVAFRFGKADVEISTAGADLADRWHRLRQPPGRHTAEVRALGGGRSRAFGVVLENGGPGVVWDTLSMTGAFTPRLLAHDEEHFARQLAHRDPDLVVLGYGGNDLRRLVGGAVTPEGFRSETLRVLQRIRSAVPRSSCLVVAINDHLASGRLPVEPRHVQTLVDAQRTAAARAGCAFWDTTAAMGGTGTFRAWQRRGLAGGDGKHLSSRGREVLAARLFAAMLAAR